MITEAIIMDDEKLKEASENNNYEVSAETIIDVVKEGAAIYSEITSSFVQEFVFYEKTLYEWATELMIEIPNAKNLDERPAAVVIERMAESYMSSTVSARVAAKIVKSFWKERWNTLLEVRKILEQIGMSLHVEMKWTNQ